MEYHYVVIDLGISPSPDLPKPDPSQLTDDRKFFKPGTVLDDTEAAHIINTAQRVLVKRVVAGAHPARAARPKDEPKPPEEAAPAPEKAPAATAAAASAPAVTTPGVPANPPIKNLPPNTV